MTSPDRAADLLVALGATNDRHLARRVPGGMIEFGIHVHSSLIICTVTENPDELLIVPVMLPVL